MSAKTSAGVVNKFEMFQMKAYNKPCTFVHLVGIFEQHIPSQQSSGISVWVHIIFKFPSIFVIFIFSTRQMQLHLHNGKCKSTYDFFFKSIKY